MYRRLQLYYIVHVGGRPACGGGCTFQGKSLPLNNGCPEPGYLQEPFLTLTNFVFDHHFFKYRVS
jgi:hypothetical protein